MRMTRLFVMSLVLGSALAACGGDDGGGTSIDAPVQIDAPMIDAPPAVSALGQVCNASTPCTAAAPDCLTIGMGATSGFCSLLCHANATFMTDAQAMPAAGTDLTADTAKCTAVFNTASANGATASCFLPLNRTPTGALVANTTYTFQAYCGVQCSASMGCPTGLVCKTNGICAP